MKNFANPLGTFRGRFVLGALLVSLLAVVVPGNSASAQNTGQGQYVSEAAARLAKVIGKANTDGYTLTDNNFSIGGGWIKQSETDWIPLYTLNLQAGKKYRFIAAGDADAKDVDLDVQDLKGKTLKKDDGAEPEAIVDFTPNATGKYLVRVRLYASDKNLPCVCLAVVMTGK